MTTIELNDKEFWLLKAILHDEADRLDRRLRDFRQGSESQRLAEKDRDDVLRLIKTIKKTTILALCLATAGCSTAPLPRVRVLQTETTFAIPAQQPNIGTVGAPRR